MRRAACLAGLFALFAAPAFCVQQPEETAGLSPWLADRGRGMATSQFGTYVRPGEWLFYTFYEYTRTTGFEYSPEELGFTGKEEHFGTVKENEELVFVSHGISDRLMFEFEGALHSDATFRKPSDDLSNLPATFKDSGLGDVEGQLRWRWSEESAHRPEFFSFFEAVLPLQKDKALIGTQDWEFALGFAAIKGFRWGTLTARASVGYSESQVEMGDYAVEYLKRLSPRWRILAAVEGEQTDEVAAIVEGQVRLGRHVLLKLNSGFGLTRKAPDVAPEVGLLFSF